MISKKNLLAIAVASSMTLLAACSHKSSNDAGPAAPTTSYQMSGVVSKGIVSNGIVTAYELNADGSVKGTVGTTTTDASGAYNLTLSSAYSGGIVKLEITAGANTKMKCDVADGCGGTGFGQEITLQNTFKLNAVVQPEGTTVKIPVTPLTHMAAARAIAVGNLSKASVAAANSEVSTLVGFDIINTEVSDVTAASSIDAKGKAATAYALYNAGVASALIANGIEAGLQKLAQSFEDGEFKADDAVTIQQIVDAVEKSTAKIAELVTSQTLKDAVVTINTQIAQTQGQIVNGGFNPEPVTPITDQAGAIAAAKALITNARTVITQGMELDKNGSAAATGFESQAQMVNDAFDQDSIVASQLLGEVVSQTMDSISAQTTLEKELANPQTYTVEIKDKENNVIGTVSVVFSTTNGLSLTINGTLAGAKTVTIENLKLATNLTSQNLTVNAGMLEAISAQNVTATLTGKVIAGMTTLTLNQMDIALTQDQEVTVDLKDNADNDGKERHIQSVLLKGNLDVVNGSAGFNGTAEVELVKLDNIVEAPMSLKLLSIAGKFFQGTETLSASAKLSISNAASFDTFHFFDAQDSLTIRGELTSQALDMNAVNAAIAHVESQNRGSVSYWNASSWGIYANDFQGYGSDSSWLGWTSDNVFSESALEARFAAELPRDKIDKVWWRSANYNSQTGKGSFMAEVLVDSPETANAFIKGQLIVTSQVQLTGLPKVLATVSVDRTSIYGGTASVLVTVDGKTFKLTAESADLQADATTGKLILSDATGNVKFEMSFTSNGDSETMTGNVLVGSLDVGDIQLLDSGVVKVTFVDGTIESLQ